MGNCGVHQVEKGGRVFRWKTGHCVDSVKDFK